MISNEDFVTWTKDLIAHDLENGESKNILQICEENFDLWTNELFPVLQRQRKSCYRAVVSLLHKGGCLNANEDMVRSYMSKIRKKRALSGQITSVAPSLTQPRSVDVVPTPVAVTYQAAPSVQAPPHQVARPAVKQALGDDQVAYPQVYAKQSLTVAVDYEDFNADLISLQEQGRSGWLEWSGTDEWHWLEFLSKIETFNKSYDPKWTVDGNQTEFWKFLESKDDISMFKALKRKVIDNRKI